MVAALLKLLPVLAARDAPYIQKVIQRWESEGTYVKRNRIGHPPKITRRQHLRLLLAIKKDPEIEYSALYRDSGLRDT